MTAADVRHTAQLLTTGAGPGDPLLKELVEPVRWEGQPRSIAWQLRQGLFDPLEPLSFWVLPRQYRGQPLSRTDDPEFARSPLGSGPFLFAGQVKEAGRTYAVFQANPGHRHGGAVREVRFFVPAPKKPLDKPLPHVILDVPEIARPASYRELKLPAWRRVNFLAINHRRPALAQVGLRRFLALAVDRNKVLRECFEMPDGLAKGENASLNGPFPLQSWACCPPPRVPRDLYQPELAQSLARELKKESPKIRLTLKFPEDDPRLEAACRAMIDGWQQLARAADLDLEIQPVALGPSELRQALMRHDFDMLYHTHDFTSAAFTLWPLFDPHPQALDVGGSNYLGYENDGRLQRLLDTALRQRHFPDLQSTMHDIHAHLNDRMPLVPLWQLPRRLIVHPELDLGQPDPLRLFAHVNEWKVPAP